jgi:hypothetical protein
MSGISGEMEVYILLKDGTVYDGMPVPPDEMDVSLSRRKEPQKWGKWRRDGKKFMVAWADRPNHYEPLEAEPSLPARRGERLDGSWSSGETSGSSFFANSWRSWGVDFTQSGTFKKFESGGSSNGSIAQAGGTSVFTVYDDDGSAVSADTPGAFVGISKDKKRGSNRAGTYEINGYAITLHFGNGKVKRLPFFFGDPERNNLYFEGTNLNRDKKK